MKLVVPELAVVVVIGASGSGKSTFCRRHFKSTEILSSDFFRGLVGDDEGDQAVTKDAFEALRFVMEKRLALGRLVVVDATNVRPEDRKPLVETARKYHCIPVSIVLKLPEKVCEERNKAREGRSFGPHVVRGQSNQLFRSLRFLKKEGFRHVHVLSSEEEVGAVELVRQPLWNNKRHEHGPFDIIGDVHGCYDELVELLEKLGYVVEPRDGLPFGLGYDVTHPEGRRVVFLGDLVDRGPRVVPVLRLVMSMVASDAARCVPGNHDMKLVRKYQGRSVLVQHGLAETLAQLEGESQQFRDQVRDFLDGLVSHYVFDDGKLVVAHAGMREEYQGRGSGRVRDFALFGETTGETDEYGLPVRFNWAAEYRGGATVVYGHTPVPDPEWLNGTINVDTGCVFGGRLTALRYPEKELVSVPARQVYVEPVKPLAPSTTAGGLSLQQQSDDMLDLDDVAGKRFITTSLGTRVTVREQNATAALEVMSRFAADPRWLIYLPPTMSPTKTSDAEGFLEHPHEALGYFASSGVRHVVCERKHMGSRAVVIVCRSPDAARERFGVDDGRIGICYTRTGRRFLDGPALEAEFLARVQAALEGADFWARFDTEWVCLDCELMPWSLKAQELLKTQYAAVGAAGTASLSAAEEALTRACARNDELQPLLAKVRARRTMMADFVTSYGGYCWGVSSLADLRLAPFHILATEGAVHADKTHQWHMDTLAEICSLDEGLLMKTPWIAVDTEDSASVQGAVDWWLALTASGGEGMVVKPLDFVARNKKGLIQPAVKCRGREYLRIIYGPEYSAPGNLERLRSRGLFAKRALALKEFALGLESLERFVAREPLRKVHECAFGVLALESEPVDPRL